MPANSHSERALDTITVGVRHRKDLGDIDELARSINDLGMLQPITITPDGVLVCGRRRLEAVRRLGWPTVKVWVRSGISDALTNLLAQQDENALHKSLSPIEQTELYKELKALYAEDTLRKRAATGFGPGGVPREHDSSKVSGSGPGPEPLTNPGDLEARNQAARAVTGKQSYHHFDRIAFLQAVSRDPFHPSTVRDLAARELAAVNDGAPVRPAVRRVRAAIELASQPETDTEDLDALAQEALNRVRRKQAERRKRALENRPPEPDPEPAPTEERPKRRTPRSFLLTWTELDGWTQEYDLDELARSLTDETYALFDRGVTETLAFRDDLLRERARPATAPPAPASN